MHVLVLNADSAPVSQLPLSTLRWEAAVKAIFSGTVVVVEEYDNWEVHSPSTTMRVPSVIMTKRYLHHKRKVSFASEKVFLRDRYTCQYCHRHADKLTMDHVLPRRHGGKTTWENIVSACGPCNFNKGDNRKIVPNRLPCKPSYYELLAIRKEFPLTVPCERWVDYLDWPESNLYIGKNILRRTIAA